MLTIRKYQSREPSFPKLKYLLLVKTTVEHYPDKTILLKGTIESTFSPE